MTQGKALAPDLQDPAATSDRLEKTLASERVEAVQQAEIAALSDILVKPGSQEGVDAIIAGAAPDESRGTSVAAMLLSALLGAADGGAAAAAAAAR